MIHLARMQTWWKMNIIEMGEPESLDSPTDEYDRLEHLGNWSVELSLVL